MTRSPDDQRLADWVDGRLSDDEQRQLEAELASDPELAERADRYRRLVFGLRKELRFEVERPSGSLTDRVMAVIEAQSTAARRRSPWPFIGSGLAAAALVTAYLVLDGIGDRTPERDDTAMATPSTVPLDGASVDFDTRPDDEDELVALRSFGERLDPTEADKQAGQEAGRAAPSPVTGGVAEPETEVGKAEKVADSKDARELADTVESQRAGNRARQQKLAEPGADRAAEPPARTRDESRPVAGDQPGAAAALPLVVVEVPWPQQRDDFFMGAGRKQEDQKNGVTVSTLSQTELTAWERFASNQVSAVEVEGAEVVSRPGMNLMAGGFADNYIRYLKTEPTQAPDQLVLTYGQGAQFVPQVRDEFYTVTGSETAVESYVSRLQQRVADLGGQFQRQQVGPEWSNDLGKVVANARRQSPGEKRARFAQKERPAGSGEPDTTTATRGYRGGAGPPREVIVVFRQRRR